MDLIPTRKKMNDETKMNGIRWNQTTRIRSTQNHRLSISIEENATKVDLYVLINLVAIIWFDIIISDIVVVVMLLFNDIFISKRQSHIVNRRKRNAHSTLPFITAMNMKNYHLIPWLQWIEFNLDLSFLCWRLDSDSAPT